MLNSKYAPVIAITVVAILIIAALGWFLAIKPQVDDAGELVGQANDVRANVQLIEATSTSLDDFQSTLDSLPDLTDSLSLNAPTVWDMPGFRARLDAAVTGSGVELILYAQDSEALIEGWEQESAALVSTQIATLFQTGPVNLPDGEEYEPPVAPNPDPEAVSDTISGIPLSFDVAGTPAEVLDFFVRISDPADPLLQVHDVTLTARPEDAPSIPGVADASDGDVIASTIGFVYMLEPDPAIIDEEELATVTLGGDSPFEEIEDAPEQPGAN